MTGFNLPTGCDVTDIPGNRPSDEEEEAFWEELIQSLQCCLRCGHEHRVRVVQMPDPRKGLHPGGTIYRPECKCGWTNKGNFIYHSKAWEAGFAHRKHACSCPGGKPTRFELTSQTELDSLFEQNWFCQAINVARRIQAEFTFNETQADNQMSEASLEGETAEMLDNWLEDHPRASARQGLAKAGEIRHWLQTSLKERKELPDPLAS